MFSSIIFYFVQVELNKISLNLYATKSAASMILTKSLNYSLNSSNKFSN